MVKALPKLYLLLLCCCASFWISAQVVNVDLMTLTDTPVSHTFLSRNQAAVSLPATFGEVSIEPTGVPFQYEFTYTPNTGFEGNDEARIIYFPIELPNTFALMRFNIQVVPIELEVGHDIASTLEGNSVSIAVLDNDFSSTGVLSLVAVPATNGGTAEIVGNNVVFTPVAGFKGLTDFNYVVCATNDSYQFCKTGTVSVNVLSNIGVAAADTTRVFAKRYSVNNPGTMILAPANYSLVEPPVNGVMELVNGIMVYKPIAGHVGVEFLHYSNGNNNMVFRVETLDFVYNDFSVKDEGTTAPDQPITLNVIENDLYGAFTGCVSFNPPQFGELTVGTTTGEVTYTPPTGWTGIDRFTYTSFPPGCAEGSGETETVTIVVSDFRPATTSFYLTTAANTNLPFTYNGPNGNISWSVIVPPTLGIVSTDSETGELIYTPNTGVVGVDHLSVQYCLQDENGDCSLTQDVALDINIVSSSAATGDCDEEGDCVWPGDTNNDGVVSISDLLPIGYHMGSAGTPRASGNPESWAPQYSEDWKETDNGVNRKHVDADGDQFVTSLDTQVVRNNLGMVNRINSTLLPRSNFDVILQGGVFAEPGDLVSIDIFFGDEDQPVEDIAGLVLPFNISSSYVDWNSLSINFLEDSWFSYDSPLLSMVIADSNSVADQYQLSAGLVRTNTLATSGHGRVGKLNFVVIEDIVFLDDDGDANTQLVSISDGGTGEAMNNASHRSAVRVRPFELNIVQHPEPVSPIDTDIDAYLDEKLMAFPNPTDSKLTVHLNGRREFTALSITDITGKVIETYNGPATNHRVIDLGQYPNGIYTLQVTTNEGVVNRKIQVFH